MRTMLNLDEKLLEYAKHRALQERVPLARVVENALRVVLSMPEKSVGAIRLVTVAGTGVRHGVDLDNNASLRDIMDDAR